MNMSEDAVLGESTNNGCCSCGVVAAGSSGAAAAAAASGTAPTAAGSTGQKAEFSWMDGTGFIGAASSCASDELASSVGWPAAIVPTLKAALEPAANGVDGVAPVRGRSENEEETIDVSEDGAGHAAEKDDAKLQL